MKVVVCGGRDFTDWDRLKETMDRLHQNFKFSLVISGGAHGADINGERWAYHKGIPVKRYPADWVRHGRKAGPIRNLRMLKEGEPDLVIAFPGGKGTQNMIDQARTEMVPVMQIQNAG